MLLIAYIYKALSPEFSNDSLTTVGSCCLAVYTVCFFVAAWGVFSCIVLGNVRVFRNCIRDVSAERSRKEPGFITPAIAAHTQSLVLLDPMSEPGGVAISPHCSEASPVGTPLEQLRHTQLTGIVAGGSGFTGCCLTAFFCALCFTFHKRPLSVQC